MIGPAQPGAARGANLLFTAVLPLAALPAMAEPWTCQLSVQCENVDCFGIDMGLDVIAADHEGQLFVTSPTGDRPVVRLSPAGRLPAAYGGAGPHAIGELLTIAEDGQAILTNHGSDGPARTITIFGTCTRL